MAKSYVVMENYFKQVAKDIAKGAETQRKKAATYLKNEVKKEACEHRVTGNYEASVYVKHTKSTSFVGSKAPHAYLVEFGTVHSAPTPIIYGTFEKAAPEVERIMSEPWVK